MMYQEDTSRNPLYIRIPYRQYQRYPKPPYSYIAMIAYAIDTSPDGQLTLREICQTLRDMFPFFRGNYTGWTRSVRHTLSQQSCFYQEGNSKSTRGNYWRVHLDQLTKSTFKRQATKETGWAESIYEELGGSKAVVSESASESSHGKADNPSTSTGTSPASSPTLPTNRSLDCTDEDEGARESFTKNKDNLSFGIDRILSDSFGHGEPSLQSDTKFMSRYYIEDSCFQESAPTSDQSHYLPSCRFQKSMTDVPVSQGIYSYEDIANQSAALDLSNCQLGNSLDFIQPIDLSIEIPRDLSSTNASSTNVDNSFESAVFDESNMCSVESCSVSEPNLTNDELMESLHCFSQMFDSGDHSDLLNHFNASEFSQKSMLFDESEFSNTSVNVNNSEIPVNEKDSESFKSSGSCDSICNEKLACALPVAKSSMSRASIERELIELQKLADVVMSCDHQCSSELCRELKECFRMSS